MDRPHPFAKEGLLLRAGPYGAAVLLAFLLVPLAGPSNLADVGYAGVLLSVTVAAVMLAPWERLPRVLEAVPPLLLFAVIAFIREAEGGAVSGFATLMLVPIVWLAIYGTRSQLAAGLVAGAVALTVPILIVGTPEYPDSEWRRAALWTATAMLVGFALQSLVRQSRERERDAAAHADELDIVVNSMSDGLVVADPDGSFRMFNRAAERILGIGATEGGSREWPSRYGIFEADGATPAHEESLPLVRAMHGEVVEDVELFVRNPHVPAGVWISVSGHPIRHGGALAGGVAVFRDITERKHAGDAQGRLAAIVESSESAIVGITLDGVITTWNRGAQVICGYAPEEAIGRHITMLMPEDRLGELVDLRPRLSAGESIDGLRTVRLHKNGARIDMSLSLSPIRAEDGRVTGASVVGRDITREVRAERYFRVQNAVTSVLAEADVDADVMHQVLCALGEGMGWDIGEFWELDEADGVLRCAATWHVERISAEEFPLRSDELAFERGAGVPGRAWATGRPVLVADIVEDENFLVTSVAVRHGLRAAIGIPIGTAAGTLGVMVFFSREIRALDDELVDMMSASSAQVGHFLERRRAEREADRLKDQFFGLVSHELRTPLTSIVGYLELLLDEDADPADNRRFLDVVKRNAVRLQRLVGDLLFVTRVQAGQFAIQPGELELHGVVHDSVQASRPAADAKGIGISLEMDCAPTVVADRDRLAQLFDNLVSNAVKYAPEGGRVHVRVWGDQEAATVEVRNTGSYIPPDERERLFERFFRASAATTSVIPGAGLGLAIAKAIADAHGARIEVTSDEQTGTAFSVRLPLEQPAVQPALSGGDPSAVQRS